MELRQLEYFCAVARHGHFRRAAEGAYVTQSALSQQVARLESELGLTLLNRTPGQDVTLTPAGHELLTHAEALLSDAADARAAMDAHAGMRRGVARIAVTVADAPWMAEVLIAFHRGHPGIQLALRQGSAAEVLSLLRRGDVDVAVCALRADHERELEITVLSDAPLVAIFGPGHPRANHGELTVGDLRDEPLILAERATALRETVADACSRAGFSPLPRFEVGDPATVRTLVSAGLGVALVPAPWLRRHGPALAVARLADAPRHRVALLTGATTSPAGRLLAQHIRISDLADGHSPTLSPDMSRTPQF